MSGMAFDDEMGRIQRALAQCHDLVVRRTALLETLSLNGGERVLEIGCGGGFYAKEAAKIVGSRGRMYAIDTSADQIAAAERHCSDMEWIDCSVANVLELPFDDETFDAVYGVQVFEYVTPLDRALDEVRRVLRTGGRCAIISTDWNTAVWHAGDPARMQRILDAWGAHSPTPNLPSILGPRLRQAGLEEIRVSAMPLLNRSAHENSFSYWIARMIKSFVVGRQAVTAEEADAWLEDLQSLEREGESFFSLSPTLVEAVKVA